MDEKTKQYLLAGAAIAVILLAVVAVFTMASRPSETIGDYKKVPAKGIGKFDKDDAAGAGGKM